MDILDIVKIVVPVIVALCSTVWATMRWTYDREIAAQKAYWQVVHDTLLNKIGEHRTQHETWQQGSDERVVTLERELSALRVKLAEEYVKRHDWLDQEKAVERKLDLLRSEISKELQHLTKEVAGIKGAA